MIVGPLHGRAPARAALAAGLLTAAVGLGLALSHATHLQLVVAVPVGAAMVATCLRAPGRSMLVLLVWLVALGTIRRWMIAADAADVSDPLLLVAPGVVAVLVVVAVRGGALRCPTALAGWLLALEALMLLAALNPGQGGLEVGAGGVLFVMVPTLWFWIGRGLVTDELLSRALRVLAVLCLGAAVYGLVQVYVGFPSWDQRWLATKGYGALRVGRSIRPFASLNSSSEYVGLLGVGTVLWTLKLVRTRRRVLAAAAVALLAWALAVASVRGALVVVPVAVGMTLAAGRGYDLARVAAAGMAALLVLGLAVSQLEAGNVGGRRTSELLGRQVAGLSDPFDPETSTLPVHVEALGAGLAQGLEHPLGRGLGLVTIAGERFGSTNLTTEIDPSNVAVSMGLPGLVSYGVVAVLGLGLAYRQARRRRDYLTSAALGMLLVTIFQWLSGGNYSVALLPWLLLGWMDGRVAREPAPVALSAVSAPG